MKKLLNFEKWLTKCRQLDFYNPDCISVNLSKIFGGKYSHRFIVNSLHTFFTNFIYLIEKLHLNKVYTINFEIPTSGPY